MLLNVLKKVQKFIELKVNQKGKTVGRMEKKRGKADPQP